MKKRVIQFSDDEAVALANFLALLIADKENDPNDEIRVLMKRVEKIYTKLETGALTLRLEDDSCDMLYSAVLWFCGKIAPVALASPNLTGDDRQVYEKHYNQAPNLLKKLQV